MRRPRMLVMAITVLGTMAMTPHAHAHWGQYASADGYQTGSMYDLFHFWAEYDNTASHAGIQVDIWTGGRPIGTYVVTMDNGMWRSDMDYTFGPNVESVANGNMVAAQYRFRSGNEMYCTRWDFDPWNGYVQYWTDVAKEKCPETFANVPATGTRPPSDLILR